MKLSLMTENIKKNQKKYNEITKKLYIIEQKNYKVINSKCISCETYLENSDVPIEKKFNNCSNCKHYEKVKVYLDEYLLLIHEMKNISKEYASVIFEVLKNEKPKLLVRMTKEIVLWDQVFPGEFKDVEKNLYSSLIALVEEVAGRYRIL